MNSAIQGRILSFSRFRIRKQLAENGISWHEAPDGKSGIWIRLSGKPGETAPAADSTAAKTVKKIIWLHPPAKAKD